MPQAGVLSVVPVMARAMRPATLPFAELGTHAIFSHRFDAHTFTLHKRNRLNLQIRAPSRAMRDEIVISLTAFLRPQ